LDTIESLSQDKKLKLLQLIEKELQLAKGKNIEDKPTLNAEVEQPINAYKTGNYIIIDDYFNSPLI
jgi:hypothetical protein